MRDTTDELAEWTRLSRTILRCLRAGIGRSGPGPLEAEAELLKYGDQKRLIDIAKGHGVLPILLRGVNRIGADAFPSGWVEELRGLCRSLTLDKLRLTGALLELLDLLRAGGIPAVPFKGPSLAALAYGGPAMRQYGDLDILLHREDIGRAAVLMQSRGYSVERSRFIAPGGAAPAAVVPPRPTSRFSLDYECRLRCPARGVQVELHWRIIPWYFAPAIDAGGGGTPLRSVNLGGRSVQTLSAEDLLIYVCMHGMKHCWDKFLLVCDVAAMVESCEGEIDWAGVRRRAAALGAGRTVGVGLRLAADLLGISPEGGAAKSLADDPAVARIAGEVRDRLIPSLGWDAPRMRLPLVGHTAARIMLHLKAKERARDRLRYCLGMGIGVVLEASRRDLIGERMRFLLDFARPARRRAATESQEAWQGPAAR